MDHFIMKLLKLPGTLILRSLAKYAHKHNWLPFWAFHEIEHVSPSSAFELWALKETQHGLEIFVSKRESNDPHWPNQWHFPGTISKITDTMESIYARLAEELGEKVLPETPKLLTVTVDVDGPRDTTVHIFNTIYVNKDVQFSTGEFHPIDKLPTPFITYQLEQIKQIKNQLKNRE